MVGHKQQNSTNPGLVEHLANPWIGGLLLVVTDHIQG